MSVSETSIRQIWFLIYVGKSTHRTTLNDQMMFVYNALIDIFI